MAPPPGHQIGASPLAVNYALIDLAVMDGLLCGESLEVFFWKKLHFTSSQRAALSRRQNPINSID
jgi:hypothetical protein